MCVCVCVYWARRRGLEEGRAQSNENATPKPAQDIVYSPPPVPLLSAAERKKKWRGSTNDNKAAVYLTTHGRGVRRARGLCWGIKPLSQSPFGSFISAF